MASGTTVQPFVRSSLIQSGTYGDQVSLSVQEEEEWLTHVFSAAANNVNCARDSVRLERLSNCRS